MSYRDVSSNLRALARAYPKAAERALYRFAQIEMAEMKRRTPVETGTLRDSGIVDRPEWKGDALQIELGFGGAAEEYALFVHEDLEAFHKVGQAKFMESVLNESEPYFAERVGKDIADDLDID
jgi:hypothetical protein